MLGPFYSDFNVISVSKVLIGLLGSGMPSDGIRGARSPVNRNMNTLSADLAQFLHGNTPTHHIESSLIHIFIGLSTN